MTNQLESLTAFEWHDLPVLSVCINADSLELLVTPFDDARGCYRYAILTLSEYRRLALSISGSMSSSDQERLEVSSFDYREVRDGLVSGKIGLLPRSAGYWEIEFEEATWSIRLSDKPLRPAGSAEQP